MFNTEEIFSDSDAGLVRKTNEDSCRYIVLQDGLLMVVCDGMGGHAGGAVASRIAVDCIIDSISNADMGNPREDIKDALIKANRAILKCGMKQPELRGMGTTACVVYIKCSKVWYGHIGDSRIYYYCAERRKLYHLTKDHSVVQTLVDQGLITQEEAEHHPEKNKIYKTLGVVREVEPEVIPAPLLPADGDVIMICSDGLSGMVSDDDILRVIDGADSDMQAAGKTLISMARDAGGLDNITVQLVRFSDTHYDKSVFTPAAVPAISMEYVPERAQTKRPKWWFWLLLLIVVACGYMALVDLLSPKRDATLSQAAKEITQPGPVETGPPAWQDSVSGLTRLGKINGYDPLYGASNHGTRFRGFVIKSDSSFYSADFIYDKTNAGSPYRQINPDKVTKYDKYGKIK